jgi:hypothetical protein
MSARAGHRRSGWRAFLTLAVLALVMKVAAPPGFMFAAEDRGAHGAPAFALVICTGHGPLDLGKDKGGQSKQRADAPCAFAGHAAPPTPAFGAAIPLADFAGYAAPVAVLADLIPGRGLAAPPPPSQGPPLFL